MINLMKEGIYTMEELKRINIIQSVIDKKRTQKEAANALNLSERQIRKIVKRYKEDGPDGIKHKNKSNKPSHSFDNKFKNKDEYTKKIEKFFSFKDNNNCKRIYDKIR